MQRGSAITLRSRNLILDEWLGPEGEIHGSTFIREIREDDDYLAGVALMDELIDKLIDENIENIVLTRNGKRHMSTIEDWQEYGKAGPTYASLDDSEHSTYLPFSYMREN